MRRALTTALAALALGAAACGGDDESGRLIPASDAEALSATLQRVEQARAAGSCQEARTLAQEARRQAGELPGSVDAELRRRIRRGISRIFELLPTQCDRPQDEEPVTTTEEPVVPEEAPVPTTEEPAPVPQTTQAPPAPEPTPTTPAPEVPEEPADGGADPGTGNGNGSNGNGNGTGNGSGGAAAEGELG